MLCEFSPSHQRDISVTPSGLRFQWVLRFAAFCGPVLLERVGNNRKVRENQEAKTSQRKPNHDLCSSINHFMLGFNAQHMHAVRYTFKNTSVDHN